MATTITVGIIGFSAPEQTLFKKIFQISQNHQRVYLLTELSQATAVQLLVVKKTPEAALQHRAYQARYSHQSILTVFVGRDPPTTEEPHYIRGVLIPSRVFAVLDKLNWPQPQSPKSTTVTDNNRVASVEGQASETFAAEAALQVLVVDDSVMMQKTVQLELNKAEIPLAIDFAETGEIALEKIALKKYDFIFLDVMMPGIDGFETCSRIRKCKGMTKVPIIMLTSKTSPADEVKGLMAGCTTYLTKPFVHEEFQKMLKRITRWVKEFNDRK
jgi:two-component system cell cycle response regulator